MWAMHLVEMNTVVHFWRAVIDSPVGNRVQNRDERSSLVCQRIFDADWHLVVLVALHNPGFLELLQRGGERGVGYVFHLLFQLSIAQGGSVAEDAKQSRLPFAAKYAERIVDRAAILAWKFPMVHSSSSEIVELLNRF